MQYTENYKLPQYEGTDPINLTDGYNEAMGIVDVALKADADNITSEVARLEGDLATTNANLNATNQNAAALKRRVDYIEPLVDELPTIYATNERVSTINTVLTQRINNVKTDVDKNTPLVEEHVNYFANLGVTDEESATALHTEIDQAFQGTMSNTASIKTLNDDLLYSNSFTEIGRHTVNINSTDLGEIIIYANPQRTAVKLNCVLTSREAVNIPLTLIPGTSLRGYDTGINLGKSSVQLPGSYSGLGLAVYNDAAYESTYRAALALGSDGIFYMMPQTGSAATLTVGPKFFFVYWSFNLSIDVPPQTLTLGDISAYKPTAYLSRIGEEDAPDWRGIPVPPEEWLARG